MELFGANYTQCKIRNTAKHLYDVRLHGEANCFRKDGCLRPRRQQVHGLHPRRQPATKTKTNFPAYSASAAAVANEKHPDSRLDRLLMDKGPAVLVPRHRSQHKRQAYLATSTHAIVRQTRRAYIPYDVAGK